jgi:hypothetical protein
MGSELWTAVDTAAVAGMVSVIFCLLVVIILAEDK